MRKQLRDYQQAAVDSIIPYWESGKEAPLLVVPTGGGKSLIMAGASEMFQSYDPDVRIIVLAHREELIRQNAKEFMELCPQIRAGIFSASIGLKQWHNQVTFAQIQSVAKQIHKFKPFNIAMIDECHLIPHSGEGQYRKTLDILKSQNPNIKLIGLTATPYRLGSGYLHTGDNAMFDGIGYEIGINTLLEQGHLVPMIARPGNVTPDLSQVHKRGGEFVASELEAAYNLPEVTKSACNEIIYFGLSQDRKAWLIFSAGIDHAQAILDYMLSMGIVADIVTGTTPAGDRKRIIDRFRYGRLKCLINCDVLTTGFNAPICDLIGLLRATESTSLYVQICGRGMRTCAETNKVDCLLLDYGGNVMRHGCIDNVQIKDKIRKREGDAPAKLCPKCNLLLPCSVMTCKECGYQFPPHEVDHDETAYSGPVVGLQTSEPITAKVSDCWFRLHKKEGKPDSVAVSYMIEGFEIITEWICLDHTGYPKTKAIKWCYEMGLKADTTTELLALKPPKIESIIYCKEGKYNVVKKRIMGIQAESESEFEWEIGA